eukprot:10484284-Alexandrium_andersonii.AAC.1
MFLQSEPFRDEIKQLLEPLRGGATALRTPRLVPPARAASPGGLTAPQTTPTDGSGAPEVPVG